MDLFEIIRVMLGRWKIVIPMVLLTFGLAAWVQLSVPPELEASGFLRLETADFAGEHGPAGEVEPFQLAAKITEELGFTVTVNPGGGGYISVSVAGPTSDEASARLEDAVASAARFVGASQDAADVAADERVDLRQVSPDQIEVQGDGSAVAVASLLLFDPSTTAMNPYQPDASTARLLQVAVNGGSGQRAFTEIMGPGYTFFVGQEARDTAGLIPIVTTGPEEERVLQAFHQVMLLLRVELDALQDRADVATPQRLSVAVVDAPIAVVDTGPPFDRAAVGVIAMGGLATLGIVFGLDWRKRRRAAHDQVDGPGSTNSPRSGVDLEAGAGTGVPSAGTTLGVTRQRSEPPPAPYTVGSSTGAGDGGP